MEVLMPSEIARLVFGYLKDEGCDSVAQLFLESSSRLEECRSVVARGKSFNTKISDMSLIDILEKYCMATTIVHEKLSQHADSDSIRKSTDLVEQLRYLLEGSRSQRFVVNINVPSQSNSQSGDSPIISGSIRKRRHSNTERDRHKRAKLFQQEKSQEQINIDYCENTEATPLESLPGNSLLNKNETIKSPVKDFQKFNSQLSGKNDENTKSSCKSLNNSAEDNKLAIEKESLKKCTMGTSTELSYANTEVQTMPCDINEPSESEWNDEPIENLSIITKELLSHTELQERIAAKINKVMYQEVASKEEGNSEAPNSEANISLMSELDNAIKTTVAATESDPVFEQFLSEIIGKIEEPDISPDEDCDAKKLPTPEKDQNSNSQPPLPEVQNNVESTLHDQNAAAVMSIINANITNQMCKEDEQNVGEKHVETLAEKLNISIPDLDDNEVVNDAPLIKTDQVECPNKDSQEPSITNVQKPADNNQGVKHPRKSNRRVKTLKPKDPTMVNNNPVAKPAEQNILPVALQPVPTIPTLVYASKEECPPRIVYNNYKSKSLFVPIRPKNGDEVPNSEPVLYLRTVNVPASVLPQPVAQTNLAQPVAPINLQPIGSQKSLAEISTPAAPLIEGSSVRKKRILRSHAKQKPNKIEVPSTIIEEALPEKKDDKVAESETKIEDATPGVPTTESVTLFAADNTVPGEVENMPSLNLDSFCLSTTGFSPLLKFMDKKLEVLPESELKSKNTETFLEITDAKAEQESSASKYDMVRRTPRSLRKNQTKKQRLSMSTPRRRSHVRTLNFDTPKKSFSTSKSCPSESTRQRSKSLCRATLFKSPPLSTPSLTQKAVKVCSPLTTMSPLPKLSSCWEKFTGMGMILGSVSPKNNEPLVVNPVSEKPKVKKSWDADLRASLSADDGKQLKNFEKNFLKENKTKDKVDNKTVVDNNEKLSKTVNTSENSLDLTNALISTNNSSEKKPVKKYAKLKTITTTVTSVVSKNITVSPVLEPKVIASVKTSPQPNRRQTALPHLVDLETPRKQDNELVEIPPTPRLHTPGNSTLSNYLKISDDSMKIQNFITTPCTEFPPTPCIVLTPFPLDKTMDDDKKNYAAASYYQPESSKNKETNVDNCENKEMESTTRAAEIIQFEVIKENLPKEAAEKELKLTTAAKDLNMSCDSEANTTSATNVHETLQTSHRSTATDTDSSDSDSSTSSSSSDSSYTSSSNCSCTTNSPKSAKKKTKTPHKSLRVSLNNTSKNSTNNVSIEITEQETEIQKNEASPAKVFPVFKETAEDKEDVKETPAKDENEEDIISETPSSSKAGIENPTNLAHKITEILESKPKIISIKTVSLPIETRLIPNISRLDSRSRFSSLSPGKKKIQTQLEEKKQRMKMALKNPKLVIKNEKPKMHNLMSLKYGKNRKSAVTKNETNEDPPSKEADQAKAQTVNTNDESKTPIHSSSDQESTKKVDLDKDENKKQMTKSKMVHKLKVDQVKRDLFSDEESSDKRTTRSSSRRIMDAQRVSTTIPEGSSGATLLDEDAQVPGVLECLQLVPNNNVKSEQETEDNSFLNTSANGVQAYIQIVYDEHNCAKKKKRKGSNSPIEMRLTDEDGRDYNLTSNKFEEIFDYPPKKKKAAPKKPAGTTVKRTRKAQIENCELMRSEVPKPLATSSPALDNKGENDVQIMDVGLLPNKLMKDKPKRKRKTKSDEDDKVEDLMDGIDLDTFLEQVHGPRDL